MKRHPGWKTLNEIIAKEPKVKYKIVPVYKAVLTWEDGEIVPCCPKCKEPMRLHVSGKCPTIIDATFIEEEKPKLPFGKENNGKSNSNP